MLCSLKYQFDETSTNWLFNQTMPRPSNILQWFHRNGLTQLSNFALICKAVNMNLTEYKFVRRMFLLFKNLPLDSLLTYRVILQQKNYYQKNNLTS